MPRNILVVCSGNTCRSPMAATLLAARLGEDHQVWSAGTAAAPGVPAAEPAIQVMAERRLDLRGHRARALSREQIEAADLVLTMTREHRRAVLDLVPGAADRTFTVREYAACLLHPPQGNDLDVPDPLGQGMEVYRAAAEEFDRLVERVARRLAGGD